MSREIKFKYVCKRSNGHIFDAIFNLAEIANGDVVRWMDVNIVSPFELTVYKYTGLKDKRNVREVFESDVYFEEDPMDDGDRRIFFVITWISERCAFSMLEVSEYVSYINNGFDVIERDFDGFYFEIMQSSIDKMHYAGNVHQNPELLWPPPKKTVAPRS